MTDQHVTVTATYAGKAFSSREDKTGIELWKLPDGRVWTEERGIFLYMEDPALTESYRFIERVSSWATPRHRPVDAPTLSERIECVVNWTRLHEAAAAVDRERRAFPEGANRPGYDGISDAFGGSYWHGSYRGLLGLLKIANAASSVAADVWKALHGASQRKDGKAVARAACRTAIMLSRLFEELHAAGVCDDPRSRICGTGEGYGLHGLRWLAGEREDLGCTSEEIRRFAYDGVLPAPLSAEDAAELRRRSNANF